METLADEVEAVKAVVGRFFPIYEVRVRPEALAFYVRVDQDNLSNRFEGLRIELKEKNYIPVLRQDGGEHILYVQRKPRQRFRGPVLNVVLLVATLGSTVFAGMLLWDGTYGEGDSLYELTTIANGALYFALPLMAILGTHEMGHYVLARKHGVAASLPFFIPAPLTFIGTFGALISMREPIPNKKALVDIGIAGPLAGLAVAFPVTLLGLYMNSIDPRFAGPNVGGEMVINLPIVYYFLLFLVPIPDNALFHPTAFAGWVGFFVTAINLLPAGQLDGGHVARALLGDKSKFLSYAAFVALLILGFLYFPSWFILAFFVLLIGLRHPPPLNDVTKIHVGRKGLGLAVLVILVLSFVPQPFATIPPQVGFEFREGGDPGNAIDADIVSLVAGSASYSFNINNTGNVRMEVLLTLQVQNLPNWNVMFTQVAGQEISGNDVTITLDAGDAASAIILIQAPGGVQTGQEFTVTIAGESRSPRGFEKELTLTILT